MLHEIDKCPLCAGNSFAPFMNVKDNMISKEDFHIVKCTKCEFHFTNPIPSLVNIGDYYKSENYVSHSSSKKGLINFVYNQVRNFTIGKKVRMLKRFSKGKVLLDIGAGTGHFLNACQKSGYLVQGLEPDADAVKFAKDNFNVSLDKLDVLHQIQANSKDIVTMWHVLEHVYDFQKDLSQVVSILVNGGFLIVAVPNLESYDALYYKEMWAAYDVPRHLYHFRKKDMEKIAVDFDLSLVSVRPMKFDSFYVSMLSEKYRNGSLLRALWIGFLSNLFHTRGGYSSQIYIFKKN